MAGRDYGLDPGTANIRIWQSGHGLVVDEKNMMCVQNRKTTAAVGNDAYVMYERTPVSLVPVFPVREGVIAGISDMNTIMETLLKKSGCTASLGRRYNFFIAVPYDITEVEKKAYYDLIAHSVFYTRNIYFVDKPLAAAMGENIAAGSSRAVMIVDMGAGSTEISVIAEGGIVISRLIRTGGIDVNGQIRQAVKHDLHMVIGDKTAEYLKTGTEPEGPAGASVTVYGRDSLSGFPSMTDVGHDLINAAVMPYLRRTAEEIHNVIGKIPPAMSDDIIDGGIYFTGGMSLMPAARSYFSSVLNTDVIFSDDPEHSVCRGLGTIMQNLSRYKDIASSLKNTAFE